MIKIFTFRTIAWGIVIWIWITFILLNIGFIIRFSGDIFRHSFHDYIFLRGKGNICINWYFAGLFFRWYFNKCGLNFWFLWNAMVTMAQAKHLLKSLTFGVQSIALSIEWNDFSDGFSIDTDWNLLSVDCPEMASSKNAFSVQSFSSFIDEVQRFKGLAWLNIVGILWSLRLNLHTPSSNSTYKRTQKLVRWFYLEMFSFLKTIQILDK